MIKVGDRIVNLDRVTRVHLRHNGKNEVRIFFDNADGNGATDYEHFRDADEVAALSRYLKSICIADVMLSSDPNEPPF